jgi:hypothetical protein
VRKNIASIVVTPQALKCAPNAWYGCEETKKPGMRAVAHRRLVPVTCVQAEEELKVTHSVRQRAVHVAEEEVTELDWIDACKQQPPVAVQEPTSRSLIEVRRGHEECADGDTDEDDRPVDVHGLAAEARKVKPHGEPQVESEDRRHLETC